jgi:hypothetical protein
VIRLSALRVPVYLSPGEPRDEVRIESGVETHYPFNYAVNVGSWLVWDPATATGGSGVAYPDSKVKTAQVRDGLSMTMGFAEVKGWQPYFRNRGNTAAALSALDPAVVHNPNLTTKLSSLPTHADFSGGTTEAIKLTGHTEWVDGRCHHSGFTTGLTPNTKVLFLNNGTGGDGKTYDVDWNNWQEGKNMGPSPGSGAVSPTYAVVTARSYFEGGVHVSMCDGSVKWVTNNVNIGVWRAYGSRDGKDLIPSKDQL